MTLAAAVTRDGLVARVGETIAKLVSDSRMKTSELAADLWPDKTPAAARRKLTRAMRGEGIRLEDLADLARVFGCEPADLLGPS